MGHTYATVAADPHGEALQGKRNRGAEEPMKLLLHPPRRGVDPVLTAPIINEHLRASSIGAMVLPPMLGLSCGQFMIQLKVDQGGNTAVDDDHEGNQKNDDCDPKYQKKEDLHRFKAQTAHYVGLFGWVTALCDAPAVVERFRGAKTTRSMLEKARRPGDLRRSTSVGGGARGVRLRAPARDRNSPSGSAPHQLAKVDHRPQSSTDFAQAC
jgi:hypothetical protein